MESFLQTKPAFLRLILWATLCTLCVTFVGCNFFGKQKDESVALAIGMLPDGSNILGTWSFSSASTAVNGNPIDAYTESYTFDPTGSAQVRLRDPHRSGSDCIAYGDYRINGSNITLYVQAVSSSTCGFGSQLTLYSAKVAAGGYYLQATNAAGNADYRFLAQRSAVSALVGLWHFGGEGGIDYIWFDEYGYFIMQLTEQNEQYLLIGYYQALATGGLQLVFFTDLSFNSISSQPLVFSAYLTDGLNLQLSYPDEVGTTNYVGTRL